VQSLLLDPLHVCFVHALNLCEVFYEFRRQGGEERAQETLSHLRDSGLIARDDMDEALWQEAGRIKADLKRISLADCFCAALAARIDGEVITADKEFKPLAEAGEHKITFIR
jgi:predicted nucleic acid-binding protein